MISRGPGVTRRLYVYFQWIFALAAVCLEGYLLYMYAGLLLACICCTVLAARQSLLCFASLLCYAWPSDYMYQPAGGDHSILA